MVTYTLIQKTTVGNDSFYEEVSLADIPVQIKNGTAAAPSHSFVDDESSGMFRDSGSDEICISKNGSCNLTFEDVSSKWDLPVTFKHYTTTERDALTPALGWMVYNTTTNQPEYYDGTSWVSMTA